MQTCNCSGQVKMCAGGTLFSFLAFRPNYLPDLLGHKDGPAFSPIGYTVTNNNYAAGIPLVKLDYYATTNPRPFAGTRTTALDLKLIWVK